MKRITINFNDKKDEDLLKQINKYCSENNLTYCDFFKSICKKILPPNKEEVIAFFVNTLQNTKEEALKFYALQEQNRWKINGRIISNWQSLAYSWVNNKNSNWKTTLNQKEYLQFTDENGEVHFE